MAQEPNRIGDPYINGTDDRLITGSDDTSSASFDLNDNDETDETAETKAIREDIEATRSQMSETIDAIQDRLSFANISGQVKEEVSEQISSAITSAKDEVSGHISEAITSAKDSVYEATRKAGRFMKNAENGLKGIGLGGNIIPFALIGTGIALAVMNSKRKSTADRYAKYRVKGRYDQHIESGDVRSRESSGDDRSTFDSALQQAGDAASSVASSVRGAADTAYRAIGDGTSAIGEKVSSLGSKSVDQYEHYMDVNPLAVGAVAAGLGAIVGLSIPRTKYEGELMGDASKMLMSQVQGTAKDAISKVQDVAEKAVGAVSEPAGENKAAEKSQVASPNRM